LAGSATLQEKTNNVLVSRVSELVKAVEFGGVVLTGSSDEVTNRAGLIVPIT